LPLLRLYFPEYYRRHLISEPSAKASPHIQFDSKQTIVTMPKITTLLFDCDNTLVLSEELAFEACADLANEILEAKGLPERYTGPQLLGEFVGQNFRGMMVSLKAKYKYEMAPEELENYVSKEEDKVIAKLKAALRPCVNVEPELVKLAASKKYLMSVVSSSALRRVKASIEKVGQDKFFDPNHVFSAATSLPTPTSKPDPAIYIHAMKVLGKTPEECVAVEDSKSGATAAFRAHIKTIGYTGSYPPEEEEKMRKVLQDAGCVVIMKDWTEFEGALAKIESGEA